MSQALSTLLAELEFSDSRVAAAQRTLLAGGRLTQEDGARLFDAPLLELGRLANAVARDRHGDRVYFTVNRQLNPTNVCVLSCKFCDYAKKPGAPGSYTMTREQILAHVDPGIHEIHIVGGLHNRWRFDDYLEILRIVKSARPDQHPLRVRKSAHGRGGGEQSNPGHEQPPVPEEVAEPAPKQKEAPEGDQVSVHDPRERLFREAEIRTDGWERDTDDRYVEDHHQVAQAEDEKCEPAPVLDTGSGLGPGRRGPRSLVLAILLHPAFPFF